MSLVGKTQLKGHGLRFEGNLQFWPDSPNQLRAKCQCGALSPDYVQTRNAAQAWHRQHKADVRAAAETAEATA